MNTSDTQIQLVRIREDNYPLFDDMLFWREHGFERSAGQGTVAEAVRSALSNPNLFLFAAEAEGRYVGWISLVYIPKVSKWRGHGHIYVDELRVSPEFRRKGIARMLMQKADELKLQQNAAGIRLYVNTENPGAQKLYESCGYEANGQAICMEKC